MEAADDEAKKSVSEELEKKIQGSAIGTAEKEKSAAAGGLSMDVKEVLANRLRELRIAKKLSQTELAEKFGVQRQVISYYETGSRTPDINFIYKAAQFFNVSTDFLLGYDYHGAQIETVNCIMKFLKDAQRMCRAVGCTDCKCSSFCYINYNISEEENYRFVKEVGKWAMEHPRKTYAQDFFEKFPEAKPDKEGVPRMCRANCYGGSCQYSAVSGAGRAPCKDCWNEEMEAADDE